MTSKELLKGTEVDLNRVIDSFTDEVTQEGQPLAFDTFKRVWKSHHMSFVLVCAPSEAEIPNYMQDLFMSALDRLELPSPLKYGRLFGEIHKPRLRRPADKKTYQIEFINAANVEAIEKVIDNSEEEGGQQTEPKFCDCFKDTPDFPKERLSRLVKFEERVAVIYVLYVLYKEQCLRPFVRIHIPVDLMESLIALLTELIKQDVADALYMFKELWTSKAFVVDALRRPPGYLSLPAECSESESQAFRELSFHLKNSLQGLSRVDDFERDCEEYSELQEYLVNTKFGQKHNAAGLVVFNGGVGKWMKSVTAQESHQVTQGITGFTTKVAKQPAKRSKPAAKKGIALTFDLSTLCGKGKRKKAASMPQITISTDDSWVNMPGIPKMARLVMIRDKARRKTEGLEHQIALDAEDPQKNGADVKEPLSPGSAEPAGLGSVVRPAFPQIRRGILGASLISGARDEMDSSTEEDEEIAQWKKDLSSLNKEINESLSKD